MLSEPVYDSSGDYFWSGESPPAGQGFLTSFTAISSPRTLRRGDRGPDVAAWQGRLRALGHDPGSADGLFGARTEAATKAFQVQHGLSADGIVGPATLAAAAVGPYRPREVPRARTPLSDEELVAVLRTGHDAAFGWDPTPARLTCAWAHVMLENGHGLSVWCNNFGNVTAFGWPGEYYAITVRERVQRDPDVWRDVAMRFRAHQDATDGAADYWRIMAGRYASALARFDAGDPEGAALELSRLGYYTAVAGPYAAAMKALYRSAMKGTV